MNKKGAFDSVVIMFSIIGIMLLVIIFFLMFNFREYSNETGEKTTIGMLKDSVYLTDDFLVYLQTPVYTCSLDEVKSLNMTYGELLIYAQKNDSSDYIEKTPTSYINRNTVGGSKLLSSIWDYCTVKYFSEIFDSQFNIFDKVSYAEFSGISSHKYGVYTEIIFEKNFLGTELRIGKDKSNDGLNIK